MGAWQKEEEELGMKGRGIEKEGHKISDWKSGNFELLNEREEWTTEGKWKEKRMVKM